MSRLTDARFLRTTPPLDHIVSRTEPRHWPKGIDVRLAGVASVGFGKPEDVRAARAEKAVKEVTILDRYNNAAVVKIVASDWIDYLQVAKFNGQWKIINVLWELKPSQATATPAAKP